MAQTVLVLLESVELALVCCTSTRSTGTGLILAVHWCWHWFDILEVVVVLALAAWEETAGAREANLCLGTSWEQADLMGTWNNLGTKEELYSTFFATLKKLRSKEELFSTKVRAA